MASPCITAFFRTGDNSSLSGGLFEFEVSGVSGSNVNQGQYQWDSSGNPTLLQSGNTSVDFSVPQSGTGNVNWTVGGNSIQLPSGTYGNITSVAVKVSVVSSSGGRATSATLTVVFADGNGDFDSHNVSVAAPGSTQTQTVTPTAGFTAVSVDISGTVNLVDPYPLSPSDNQGHIYVYTSACST